jgi:hypothetical protein
MESGELRRETPIKRCENCGSAIWAFGLSRPILICSNKAGEEGKYFVIQHQSWCKNYTIKKYLPTPIPLPDNDDVRYIPLTQGRFAIVDAEDYDRLSQYKWHAAKSRETYYAHRGSNGKTISMHREIMRAPKGSICDHKNHNGLDNRKSNLRLCTNAQNQYNKAAKKGCASRYKGVIPREDYKRWRAKICFGYKRIHLGYFPDQIKAASAYDDKAAELFGEFANLNFPERIELKKWIRKIILAASNTKPTAGNRGE